MDKYILRVAAESHPAQVAGAIAGQMRERGYSQVRAIGMAAVYRMFKAVIRAKEFLEDDGIQLACRPEYVNTLINGQERQVMQLYIYAVNRTYPGECDFPLDMELDRELELYLNGTGEVGITEAK